MDVQQALKSIKIVTTELAEEVATIYSRNEDLTWMSLLAN